jgi:hypothetical protein
MNNLELVGRWLVIAGISIVVVGGLVWLAARVGGLSRLPGTLRIEGAGFTCLVPILGSILLSIVLTVVLNVILRLGRK